MADIEGLVPKAGGLLAIGPQHSEDPLDNQPDGVEEEAGDQGEDHLEGYFPRCRDNIICEMIPTCPSQSWSIM